LSFKYFSGSGQLLTCEQTSLKQVSNMTASFPPPEALIHALAERSAGRTGGPPPLQVKIPAAAYTDEDRFHKEHQRLIMGKPVIVGHESQIPDPGDTLVYDWLGLPIITIRNTQGEIGSFLNVCRHRGMRLLEEEGQSCQRSLVCPYHQWTYGLDGALRNIPLQESFGDINPAEFGLKPVPTEVRAGMIWVLAQPGGTMDLESHLAGLDAEVERFGLGQSQFHRQSVKRVPANWKLIQDAFLDGYHVVRLHKNTVGPFFPDSMAESDWIGDHIRNAVARNEITEAVDQPQEGLDLRHHATFSYTVFPNSVLVMHPEYTSIMSFFPQSVDETLFVHSMMTPRAPKNEEERAHFERSFELIDRGVFEAEDIRVCIGAQKGLRSGANDGLLFGGFESWAVNFHRRVEEYLQD